MSYLRAHFLKNFIAHQPYIRVLQLHIASLLQRFLPSGQVPVHFRWDLKSEDMSGPSEFPWWQQTLGNPYPFQNHF